MIKAHGSKLPQHGERTGEQRKAGDNETKCGDILHGEAPET